MANANHAYVIGIVVGLAMGVFYALDGWNGSKKIIQFKDSARARNLLWVAGGAFMAIFADIRAVTPASATPPGQVGPAVLVPALGLRRWPSGRAPAQPSRGRRQPHQPP